MADPITLMAVGSMAATAAGGGISAFGKYQEGQATAEMYKYRQAVAQQNAMYEQAAGDVAAQRSGMKTRYEIGETKVAQGAGNIDVMRGSAADVRTSEHDVGVQEQGITRANYLRRAYGLQEEAKLDVFAGKEAKIAGDIGAAGSLVSAAGSVSDKWLSGRKIGLYS
jgi:hypothetical protein